MAANESGMVQTANALGRLIFGIALLAVLAGIGFSFWPKIKAAYLDGAISTQAQPTQPAADTSAIDRLKAENAAIQAQLNAARAAQQQVVVQKPAAGEAPQPVSIPAQPAPVVPGLDGVPVDQAVAPPPAPIIIVHQVSADGAHQTVTGSGACKVTRVAARCGDK